MHYILTGTVLHVAALKGASSGSDILWVGSTDYISRSQDQI